MRGESGYDVVYDGQPGFEALLDGGGVTCVAYAHFAQYTGTRGFIAPGVTFAAERVPLLLVDRDNPDEAIIRRTYVDSLAQWGTLPSLTPERRRQLTKGDLVSYGVNPSMLLVDIVLPLLTLGLAGAGVNVLADSLPRLRPSRADSLLANRCPGCGYDTTGVAVRCPECAEWLTPDGAPSV